MFNSARCLLSLADDLRDLMHHTPVNPVTVGLLARVLDGLSDYAALLAAEMKTGTTPKTALRVVTTDAPKHSRRKPPTLRIVTEE